MLFATVTSTFVQFVGCGGTGGIALFYLRLHSYLSVSDSLNCVVLWIAYGTCIYSLFKYGILSLTFEIPIFVSMHLTCSKQFDYQEYTVYA